MGKKKRPSTAVMAEGSEEKEAASKVEEDDEGQMGSNLADHALHRVSLATIGVEKVQKEFLKLTERLDEVEKRVQMVQQSFMDSKMSESTSVDELVAEAVKNEVARVARLSEAGEEQLAQNLEEKFQELRKEMVKLDRMESLEGEVAALKAKMAESPAATNAAPEETATASAAVNEEITAVKRQNEELKVRDEQLQKELEDATASIREELIRLSDLTLGLMGTAKDLPTDMESLRREVAVLQEKSTTQTPTSANGMAHEPTSQENAELSQELCNIRKEILRAKELFQSGQKSAGVVLSDLMLLKQEVHELKQTPAPLAGYLERLRQGLRQELADEFSSLSNNLIKQQGTRPA